MKEPICNSPVFIVGSYRSGTSVLTWCLGQHPNILPLPETHWIAKLSIVMHDLFKTGTANGRYSHLGALGWNEEDFYAAFGRAVDLFVVDTREPRLRFIRREGARKHGLDEHQIDEWEKTRAANPAPLAKAAKNYQVVRDPSDPKRRWVDGTPDNSYHMYGLSMLFPNAKFVHILRNPNDVARSLMRFSQAGDAGHDYSELEAYAAWRRLTEFSVKGERALGGDKVLRISYEGLVGDSEKTLRQCLAFLGEEFTVDCLLPLRERINSSKVENTQTALPNPMSEQGRLANDFYRSICDEILQSMPDTQAHMELEELFQEYVLGSNPAPRSLITSALNRFKRLLKPGSRQ
jgi:hypothetical protein